MHLHQTHWLHCCPKSAASGYQGSDCCFRLLRLLLQVITALTAADTAYSAVPSKGITDSNTLAGKDATLVALVQVGLAECPLAHAWLPRQLVRAVCNAHVFVHSCCITLVLLCRHVTMREPSLRGPLICSAMSISRQALAATGNLQLLLFLRCMMA